MGGFYCERESAEGWGRRGGGGGGGGEGCGSHRSGGSVLFLWMKLRSQVNDM